MTAKRTPPDHEIMAMAAELRPMVKTGETVVPFIRRNQQRLRQLIEEESWATFARVMTALGMTYSSGTPWTARYIANEFDRATMPLKRRRGGRTSSPAAIPTPTPKTTGEGAPSEANPINSPPLPTKRFVLKSNPRLEPPRVLTEEEVARRDVLDERVFGKR